MEKGLKVSLRALVDAAWEAERVWPASPTAAKSPRLLRRPSARHAPRCGLQRAGSRRGARCSRRNARRTPRAACRRARFMALPGSAGAAANKRIGNILKKIEGDRPTKVDEALLAEAAEKALFAELAALEPAVQAFRRRLLRRDACFARGAACPGRRLLRSRHGQRRRRGAARQPSGAPRPPLRRDEPRRGTSPDSRSKSASVAGTFNVPLDG